jgi:hypothetical protein
MKPNIPLNTGSGTAYFFFETGVSAKLFDIKGMNSFGASLPSFIIHQDTLFCRAGFYFVAGDAGVHYFSSTDVLSCNEFLLLCELICSAHKEFKEAKEATKDLSKSNHTVDALAYSVHLQVLKFPMDSLENKIIDQLNIPGLEKSLGEALERENYKAAAHIKKRIEQKGHKIFEVDGKLLIRRPAPETTNQNN